MAEIKTKENNASVLDFINSIADTRKKEASLKLLKIFEDITGQKGKMWGEGMIGFGKYHYKSEKSAQEGDWPLTAFSPRKQALTVYFMGGAKHYKELLGKLGKHKMSSGSCVYIQKLDDVDMDVLQKLIKVSYADFKAKHA